MCSNSARAESHRLSGLASFVHTSFSYSVRLAAALVLACFAADALHADDRPLDPIKDPGECPIDAPVRVASVDSLRHFEGLIGHCEATAIIESPAYRANRPKARSRFENVEPIPAWEAPRNRMPGVIPATIAAKVDRADSKSGEDEKSASLQISSDSKQVAIVPPPSKLIARQTSQDGAPTSPTDNEAILALRPQSYSTVFDEHIAVAARSRGVDPLLLHAVIRQESNYRQRVVSRAGARGLMQVMPATGRMLGVANSDDLFDSQTNINAGARLIAQLWQTFDGDIDLVLAAYNAGEGAVRKHGMRIPPYRETQDYVAKVKAHYTLLASESGLAVSF